MFDFIVFGGSSVIVMAVLRAIRSFSNGKIIVLGDHDTQSLRWSFLFQKHVAISLRGSDDEKCIRILNALAKNSPHSVLIPCDCDAVRMANRMRDRITIKTIPFPETASLNMFDDKWAFYEFCLRNALPTPETFYIGTKDQCDFDAVVAKTGLPFILKPSNQAGSKGIEVIGSKADYDRIVDQNPHYIFNQLIAQRYIDGEDIDISLYAIKGKLSAYAIQQSGNGKIHFTTNPDLISLADILCRQTAYHGVMHVDARIDQHTGTVYLIESNPRFWASLTAAALCGLNFLEEIVTTSGLARQSIRELTSGSVSNRPPFIDPSNWSALLFDASEHGRMLRAMTFDLPALFTFIKSLPVMVRLYFKKRLSRHAANGLYVEPDSVVIDNSLRGQLINVDDALATQPATDCYSSRTTAPARLGTDRHSCDIATLS